MKEVLSRNLALKILSLALAFVIWVSVVNISNPTVSATKKVAVSIRNENVILDTGKTYDIEEEMTVSVSYSVKTRDLYKILASDFEAYIDMAELYDVTGSVPVHVDVVNNENLLMGTPIAKPGVFHVEIDDYIRVELGVAVAYGGAPADGYYVSGASVTPGVITIRGPKRRISSIEYAQVDANVDGKTENVSGNGGIKFMDAAGRTVDVSDERITYSDSRVDYEVLIEKGDTPETQPETTVPKPTQETVPDTTIHISVPDSSHQQETDTLPAETEAQNPTEEGHEEEPETSPQEPEIIPEHSSEENPSEPSSEGGSSSSSEHQEHNTEHSTEHSTEHTEGEKQTTEIAPQTSSEE